MTFLCGNHLQCILEQGWCSGEAFTSHQCGQGLIPGLGVICGLSLLLVLFVAPRYFSLGTPLFPSPHKPTFPISILI